MSFQIKGVFVTYLYRLCIDRLHIGHFKFSYKTDRQLKPLKPAKSYPIKRKRLSFVMPPIPKQQCN